MKQKRILTRKIALKTKEMFFENVYGLHQWVNQTKTKITNGFKAFRLVQVKHRMNYKIMLGLERTSKLISQFEQLFLEVGGYSPEKFDLDIKMNRIQRLSILAFWLCLATKSILNV